MQKTLLISGVLLALTASVASAGGINLSWNDCGAFGLQNQSFLCNTNSGTPFQMFASFEPAAYMPKCGALEWVVDLKSAGAVLPAWWNLKGTADAAGRCRDAGMAMNTNFTAGPFGCADPWGGSIGLEGTQYVIGYWGPNTARISGVQAVSAAFPVALSAGTEYYAFSLIINPSKTVGTGACDGCAEAVCIVLNEIKVEGFPNTTQQLTGPLARNFVTWQGGAIQNPGCPLATPTTRSSWGKIKSSYR